MSKKIEELLPDLLRNLSRGIAVSAKEVSEQNNISQSSIRSHLRDLEKNFYKHCYRYDGSTKKWVVVEMGFLNRELLKPEEVVVLNGIYRNKDRLGSSLSLWHTKIVDSYLKRAKSYIFKQHKAEDITEDMEQIFAIVKNAINDRKKLQLNYGKVRTVSPYRIVYIEYYWYLICFEESENGSIIKSFRLSKIRSPKVLDENNNHDFSNVDLRLKLAMNAYVDFQSPIQTIEILVSDVISNHVEIASYFEAWRKTDYSTIVNNTTYNRFEVKTTNPSYDDIIPTILKYMPHMLVESPSELKEAIDARIESYMEQYKL